MKAIVAIVLVTIACRSTPRAEFLDIATTTSMKNSGLLDAILPSYTAESGIVVRVHAAGSGRALEMLADGVVDLALSHAPVTEAEYLGRHPEWLYRKIAYNWFVIVGPKHDPAEVRTASDAADAFRRIASSPVVFVSRGDASGTHERELRLWDVAGVRPPPERLLISGRGMALALRHAHERSGYTLSDEATFWQLQPQLDLVEVFRDDRNLLNTYAAIYPGPASVAAGFAQWFTSGMGRAQLAAYRIAGRMAFQPWPQECPASKPDARPCASQ